MRLFNLYFVILILFAAFSSPVFAGPNLIVNGTFEDGLNNWQLGNGFNFPTNVASTSTDTPSGTGNSADLDINPVIPNDPNQSVDGLPWLIQDVPVTAGDMLIFTASVREVRQFIPPNTNSNYPDGLDAWITAQVWFLPNSESGTILDYGFATFTNPAWETISFDKNATMQPLVVPAAATIARVLFTPQNPAFGVGTGRYRIDDVSLATPGLPGDYNGNGAVDAGDYVLWRKGGPLLNEVDTPGTVNPADYTEWRARFGNTGAGSGLGSSSVPEPTTLVLANTMTAVVLLMHRRRSIAF